MRIAEIGSSVGRTVPLHVARSEVKWSDNLGDSIGGGESAGSVGQTGESRNTGRTSAAEIQNQSCLPAFENARQHAGTVAEEQLVRTNGQLDYAICPEIMSQRAVGPGVIRTAVQWICIAVCIDSQRFRPRVSGLCAETVSRTERKLYLHGVVVGEPRIRFVVRARSSRCGLQLWVGDEVVLRKAPERRDITCWRHVVRTPQRCDPVASISYDPG